MSAIDDDEYSGPAVIEAAGICCPVGVDLAGRLEPVDGRYHWGGRIAPHEHVERLLRDGHRSVTVKVGEHTPAVARLAEVDPWGGIRVVGTSSPPWATPLASTVESS